MPDRSPPSPTLPTSAAAPTDTPGPSFTSQHSPEYVHASSRKIAGVMDAVCSLAATQEAQDQRLDRVEATLKDCRSMLQQIMTHLVFHVLLFSEMSLQLQQQPLWMCWQQQQLLQTHHHHNSEVVRFLLCFFYSYQLYQLPTNFD